MYFKRILATGSRKDHSVSIITSVEKDFASIYRCRQSKLFFYFGEWNSSGFPQHGEVVRFFLFIHGNFVYFATMKNYMRVKQIINYVCYQ